ncbi:MAG TPA: Y4yA family PLP-dependent enzyme [Pseudonocardiaceae bacterium]|jgi:diaminopimelate decarboxylase|nr:Y4yA family PLP-dependent enzyme [Pseudonocardiaceae bacterium]
MELTTHLPARQEAQTRRLLGADRALVHDLARAVGGPFHVVFPERFAAATGEFCAAMGDAGVDGQVYFAKKANKASCWIRCCAELGIGVDVASIGELRGALGEGVRGERIVVTGPAKSAELHRLATLHGCLLTVDALDELAALIGLSGRYGVVRLLLRAAPPDGDSRFGMTETELEIALRHCRDAGSAVQLEGFSFHLTGYAPAPRAELAASLVGWVQRARAAGLPASCVNIGGGFAVSYVDAEDWRLFAPALRAANFHGERQFAEFYPYHSPVAGADMLRVVLATTPAGQPHTLTALLREAGVTLLCEPGRALLDQAGFTVLRVQGVKERGYAIITVDGTSLSLSEQWFNSEFLPDPVLISDSPRQPDGPEPDGPAFPACVAGVSCLESDLFSWRKIQFPHRPAIGDLLVYLNTAGYQMDSNESPFHDLPLPPKVVVWWEDGVARWRWDSHE